MRQRETGSNATWRGAARVAMPMLAAWIALGCRQFLGADTFTVVGDGGAKKKALPTGPTACEQTGYPSAPPAGGDDGGGMEFTVSTATETWGDVTPRGALPLPMLGFNLDGVCTTGRSSSGCAEPTWAKPQSDGPTGIDNSIGQLLIAVGDHLTALDRLQEKTGARSYLLRVRGYDGTKNDGSVQVAFFSATTNQTGDPDGGPDAGASGIWFVGSNWGTPETPAYVDTNAYVANGKLVAQFSELLFGGPTRGYETVNQVKIVGDVVPAGETYTLENLIIAGRWPIRGILDYTSAVFVLNESKRCTLPAPSEVAYADSLKTVCQFVDVSALGNGTAAPCDALSFGFEVTATKASIAGTVPSEPDDPCPPDFGMATCEMLFRASSSDASAARD